MSYSDLNQKVRQKNGTVFSHIATENYYYRIFLIKARVIRHF